MDLQHEKNELIKRLVDVEDRKTIQQVKAILMPAKKGEKKAKGNSQSEKLFSKEVSKLNASSKSYDFLKKDEDLYTVSDLKVKYGK